jgi:hypothetical protein
MNPTDKDENQLPLFPGLLPYGHTVGAPAFRPTESGIIVSKSYSAMQEQVGMQRGQILQQVELLKKQYEELETRVRISEYVYSAEVRFTPDVGHTYHLYSKGNTMFLSLINPREWKSSKITFLATVKLLADMTWEVLETSKEWENC